MEKLHKRKSSVFLLSTVISLLTIIILLTHINIFHPIIIYSGSFILASLIYIWMGLIIFKTELPNNYFIICIVLSLLIRLSFITTFPIGSDDIYRYMWDGKVQFSGINPYQYEPDSDTLKNLHSLLLPSHINHPYMKTPYLPFSEWIFYICFCLSSENILGYKLIIFISELFTIIGLLQLLRHLKLPNRLIFLYSLCPLPIYQFAIDSHIDAVGIPFLVFGLLYFLQKRVLISSILFSMSISIKPTSLVILPFLILHTQHWKERILLIFTPVVVSAAQFIPYLHSTNPFDGLLLFAKHWTFNGPIFEALNSAFRDNQKVRLICAILLSIALILLYFSKRPFLSKIYYSMLLLLLFSPVVHPWYICWLTVLLPFSNYWSGISYSATASITSITVLQYILLGIWQQSLVLLIIEYLPVFIFIMVELKNKSKLLD